MFTKTIFTLGALAVAASAVPFKRDIVYVTETAKVIETVAITHTVWIDAEPTSRRHGHGHRGKGSSAEETTPAAAETTTEATSTAPVYVAPTSTSAVAESTSSPVEVAPASTEEAESITSSTTSSTSIYVAPTTTSTTEAYVAPATTEEPETTSSSSTSVYVAPTTTSTTEAYVAPATTEEPSTTSVAPAPTSYEAPAETSAVTSDNSASTHTGDLTWYTPGLGSCGVTSSESDAIVALPHGIMTPQNGANPNDNPLCGRTITINYNGESHQAKVVDTCGGCAIDDLDVSPTLFQAVAPNGDGRVPGVSWHLN